MNPFKIDKTTPLYIKQELEKVQRRIAPIIRKSGIFAFKRII